MPLLSSQETSIPEETLVTVVKPGLPTAADLHVLLPANQPKKKRSITSDKVTRAMHICLDQSSSCFAKSGCTVIVFLWNSEVIPAYVKISLPPDKIHVNATAAMSAVFDSVQTSCVTIYFFLELISQEYLILVCLLNRNSGDACHSVKIQQSKESLHCLQKEIRFQIQTIPVP